MERIAYDEFGLLHENASEYEIRWHEPPMLRREQVDLPDGRPVSALVWGDGEPDLVLVHGTAMNAHTWDTVALALDRPLVAVDLPGHGHSGWRPDAAYSPWQLGADLEPVVEQLAPRAAAMVGMSLGGLTLAVLGSRRPDLVRRLVLVDITPGTNREKAKAVVDFVDGPQSFPSFEDLLARTVEHHPTRSVASLRRGILHNARQLDDGSWVWRYDRSGRALGDVVPSVGDVVPPVGDLWEVVGLLTCPLLLVRGGASPVVDDADVAELRRRRPEVEVVVVDGAGHSVQGDRPLELADVLRRWVP